MDYLWIVLYPLLAFAPLATAATIERHDSALTAARWRKFVEMLRAGGFRVFGGGAHGKWSGEGTWDGLPFAIEVFRIQQGKSTISRMNIRMLQPTGAFDASVRLTLNVQPAELGTMQEVQTDAQFATRFRVFAQAPEQVREWLGPSSRALMLELQAIQLDIKSGAVMLTLRSELCEAFDVLRAVELLAAIHGRREPRRDALGVRARFGWSSHWTAAYVAPLIIGFVGGFVLPMIPGVTWLMSPLVCEKGDLRMVWSSSGNGKSSGNLYCVTRSDRESTALRPLLLGFNGVFWTMTLILGARALRRKPEPFGVRTLAPARPAGYRQT